MQNRIEFPGALAIEDFDYYLPNERIALYPLEVRDEAKLLVYQQGNIFDSQYQSIDRFLKGKSLMIFNESKVVQARLNFPQSHGSTIEIFCLEPVDKHSEINLAMQSASSVEWRCIVGGVKKWKDKFIYKEIFLNNGLRINLRAELLIKEGDTFRVKLSWNDENLSFEEILIHAGSVPLPPYIKRETDSADSYRYQTVYAKNVGSVAAPTAGLHFTPQLLESIMTKGIDVQYITLHVGAGTFKPVKAAKMSGHEMHSEQIVLTKKFIEVLLNHPENDVVSVGTTSARTLESLYWLGLKMYQNKFKNNEPLTVDQWDPYYLKSEISLCESLEEIMGHLNSINSNVLIFRTAIIIAPGYNWKMVNVLVTNFHQPKSTLMLLVASFIGSDWKRIYSHALNNDFRFLSYGDGSLLFRS